MRSSLRRALSLVVTLAAPCALAAGGLATSAAPLAAQVRVGRDSATRLQRFGRDLLYGTAMSFAYAGLDQALDDPTEWPRTVHGYERRLALDLGEFVVQEGTTEGLAAWLQRPLDYRPCPCEDVRRRVGWALQAALTDPLPDGTHPIAVPRIVGAYAGSVAHALWRPRTTRSRARVALVNGTTSLAIGAGINLWYEWRARRRH